MRTGASGYAALAFGLGVFGFSVLELFSYLQGFYVLYLGDTIMLALAFGLASLLCAFLLGGLLRWARGWRIVVAALPYFVVFALVGGVLYGLLLLPFLGRAPAADDVGMALFYTPVYVTEMLLRNWFLSVPLGLSSLWLLRNARRAREPRVRRVYGL
ncbi:hypothetical protein BH24DEI1_BH24DEI1_10320 [soil metagenome]